MKHGKNKANVEIKNTKIITEESATEQDVVTLKDGPKPIFDHEKGTTTVTVVNAAGEEMDLVFETNEFYEHLLSISILLKHEQKGKAN